MFDSRPRNIIPEEQYLPANYDVAPSWYQKQAELGKAEAQNHLGWMYRNGYGVKQDNTLAAQWYAKSAAQHNAKGQYNLGLMYEEGLGGTENYAIAIEYYKKAAEQGNVEAIFRLGVLYEQGLVIPRNYGIAFAYYKKAAELGFTAAQYCMGFMYEHGYGVIKDYNLAINYYKAAIEEQHPQALYRLGLMYEYGYGVTKNFKSAVFFYQKAANLGEPQAQYCLGTMYEHGLGVDKDSRLAIFWYKKSAEQDNLDAKNRLKIPILMNEFTYSRRINGYNQLSYKNIDNIPAKENYLSATIVITYNGPVNIGSRVIISTEINNPYHDIYNQVMITSNDNRVFSCLDCLFTPLYKYNSFFIRQYQEKIDLISVRCEQFWQQQEQALLQQADNIVEQIIEKQYKLILSGQQADLLCTSYATTETDSLSCSSAYGAASSMLNAP